jgi:hypothetical protein
MDRSLDGGLRAGTYAGRGKPRPYKDQLTVVI